MSITDIRAGDLPEGRLRHRLANHSLRL